MINVSDTEADNVAEHLNIPRKKFDDLYIETSLGGKMIINTIPCHFLNNNTCTVYEHRFAGCREFPALHLPQFKDRLFTIFMHYDRCPIIFNVIEQLKQRIVIS
jgi:Fe-S-cluster containining protein